MKKISIYIGILFIFLGIIYFADNARIFLIQSANQVIANIETRAKRGVEQEKQEIRQNIKQSISQTIDMSIKAVKDNFEKLFNKISKTENK